LIDRSIETEHKYLKQLTWQIETDIH